MPELTPSDHLRPRETWLRLIADLLPAYIAYVDSSLRYQMVNRTYEIQFNLSEQDILGRSVADVLGPSYENVRHYLQGALSGVTQRFETRMKTSEGDRILSVTHLPDRDEDGVIHGVIVHGVDMTERHHAEETLRRSDERFRLLLDRASIGVNIGNAAGDISYMNPALLDILGYSVEEIQSGKVRWNELTPPQYAERDQTALRELLETGRATPYEKHYMARDGRLVPMLLGAAMIPSLRDDTSEDIAVFFTDLTLQKQTEQALLQNEKLAAVGKLASSISHEINNPLEAATNLLFLARMDPGLSPETRGYLDIADREIARVAQVASQTLRFHRQSTRALTVGPDALVEEVLTMYRPRLENAAIQIERSYASRVTITCRESEIRQVLNNLIGNAIDAMPYASTLRVRTGAATRWSDGTPGVRIVIADTGRGIAQSVLPHIFEAFFTTKDIHGTGLGLWISKSIVNKHGGMLCVRSSTAPRHRGTVFTLWLPLQLAFADE